MRIHQKGEERIAESREGPAWTGADLVSCLCRMVLRSPRVWPGAPRAGLSIGRLGQQAQGGHRVEGGRAQALGITVLRFGHLEEFA